MNSFIARKLQFSFFIALSALCIFSFIFAHWYYDGELTEQQQAQFVAELSQLNSANHSLEQDMTSLLVQGQLINKLLSSPTQSSVSHSPAPRSKIPSYRLDLINKKSERSEAQPHHRVNQYSEVLQQSLRNLVSLPNIKASFFVWHGASQELEFIADKAGFDMPTEVLTWLSLHNHQKDKLLNSVFVSPPFKIAQTEFNRNYMIYSFTADAEQYYLVSELTRDALMFSTSSDADTKLVLWHSATGFLVNSNVESQRNKYVLANNPLLAVNSLPLALQKQIIYQMPQGQPRVNLVETESQVSHVATKVKLAQGEYQALLFKPDQDLLTQVYNQTLKLALIVWLIGVAILLLFFSFIIVFLAQPTSKLVEFIEQQSSVFDVGLPDIPKGWTIWFEKVQSSFQDNRHLLQSLTDKNKELDNKVKARTRALMQQTISKDRNLALNRAMMNTIPDSLYFKNVSGGYLGCNKAYEALIGLTEAQLVAKTAADVFSPEKAARIEAVEQDIIQSNKVHIEQEVLKQPEGQDRLIRWLFSPITNNKGEVLGILGLGQDITEQQQSIKNLSIAAEEAERANQVKGEFIANISHEIRTPMNSIIGMLQLLQESQVNSDQQGYIKIADSSAKSLLAVINNILDFSKGNADKLELDTSVFSISDVLSASFANSAPKAIEKGVILETLVAPDFPELLRGDEIKLGQIFTNLIGNAVKFTEQGSVIVSAYPLSLTDNKQKLAFEIRDTGIGIAEELQEKVFEAFSQADNSVTREYGGTGLGLTITYQLVELLQGTIKLESTVGEGTCFTLIFEFEPVSPQPECIKPDVHWWYWEQEQEVSVLLHNKLESCGLSPNQLTSESELTRNKENILVCRPELVKELPQQVITWIQQGRLQLQPVSYRFTAENTVLEAIPHLPTLTAPFSARSLLLNALPQLEQVHRSSLTKVPQLTGLSVLVVEDNKVNQQVLELMLKAEQAEVDLANNGMDALSKLDLNTYDVMITDIQMPIMDGLSLTKQVRNSAQKFAAIPIVVVSAHTSDEDKQKSLQAGANEHLAKPVNKAELLTGLLRIQQTISDEFVQCLAGQVNTGFLLNQFEQSRQVATKVLQRFLALQQTEFDDFCQQAHELALETVKQRVHSYKGMLGNIGADKAYEATVKFEAELKQKAVLQSAHLSSWQQSIEALFDAIKGLQG